MTEKFTAILLDTSIYDQYGLKLEKGLLKAFPVQQNFDDVFDTGCNIQ